VRRKTSCCYVLCTNKLWDLIEEVQILLLKLDGQQLHTSQYGQRPYENALNFQGSISTRGISKKTFYQKLNFQRVIS
jgi:hypothetical protein